MVGYRRAGKVCQALFHWFGGRLEKESFLFVSGRARKRFLPDQLLDAVFKTDAASRAEMQDHGVCSAADGENKRRIFCFLRFFDNQVIFHVRQRASFLHQWCIDLIAGI